MSDSSEILEYDIRNLTSVMVARAQVELHETNETRTRALKELRCLIKNEKNLLVPLDEDYLLQYLRARKFDAKRAFEVLENFWSFCRKYHHVYDNMQLPRIKEILLKNYISILPYRDRNGSTIFIFKVGQWNTSKITFEEILQVSSVMLNAANTYPATQVCGYRFIYDLKGFSWSHLRECLTHLMMVLHVSLNCFPARYKGFHCISGNRLFNRLTAVFYPLLTSKLKKRVFFHGSDMEALKQFIHPSVLPKDYGGEGEAVNNSHLWKKSLEDDAKTYLKLLTHGYKN